MCIQFPNLFIVIVTTTLAVAQKRAMPQGSVAMSLFVVAFGSLNSCSSDMPRDSVFSVHLRSVTSSPLRSHFDQRSTNDDIDRISGRHLGIIDIISELRTYSSSVQRQIDLHLAPLLAHLSSDKCPNFRRRFPRLHLFVFR